MADQAQINENARISGIKPVFSDGFLIGFRLRTKPKKGKAATSPINLKPEDTDVVRALIEITFVDESRQQALGIFIIDREAADDLSKVLIETVRRYDEIMGKDGLSKIMPKNAPKRDDNYYR